MFRSTVGKTRRRPKSPGLTWRRAWRANRHFATIEALEERHLLAAMTIPQMFPGGGVIMRTIGGAQAMTVPAVAQAPANANGQFDLQLQKSPALLTNAAASAAFDLAAAYWESVFFDPIVVIVDADFSALGPGIIGGTFSSEVSVDYTQLRSLLVADAQAGEELVSQIPALGQSSVIGPPDDGNGAFNLTGAKANRATLKALGVPENTLPGPASEFNPAVIADMSMAFSTEFDFDFDPSDGIGAGQIDFVGVAIHEIGHGLGFVSSVDDIDVALEFPGQVSRDIEIDPLDFFRLRPGAGSVDFTNSPRVLTPIGDAVFYDGVYNPVGFSIPGLTLGDVPMSTGIFSGDGNQASHWKADDITGVTIGIMDPTIADGQLAVVTATDLRAFGLIGWDLLETLAPVELNITGVSKVEGNAGTTDFVFTVFAGGPITADFTVDYATVAVTATADVDYASVSGTLTFGVGGPTTQTITIAVNGDLLAESNETFLVQLSNPTEPAVLGIAEAVGQILNDDIDLTIGDVTIVEGHAGTKNAVFTVSALGVVGVTATVSYTTLDGSATAPADYLPRNGLLTFLPGVSAALITVPVVGDTLSEGAHSFFVLLHSPTVARVVDELGVGSIVDDDPLPSFYVNDVQVTTTAAGQLAAVFTVALDKAAGREVTVAYVTADGSATNGVDYVAQGGVLTFSQGVTTQPVVVPIMTSAVYSPNKKFFFNLSSPSNALMSDSQGVGTIVFASGPTGELILDNGDSGYSHSGGGWTNVTNTLGYGLDYDHHTGGNGSAAATWTFANITNGTYQVFASWVPFSNRATNAPFTVLDGATPLGSVAVNQQLAPAGDQSNGITWQSLGTFQINTRTLAVRLTNNANGYVIADAIRIVSGGIGTQTPEMDVASGEQSISTGDSTPAANDGTDFGEVNELSGSLTRTFTIANNGNADLHLIGSPRVTVSGAAAADFTVVAQPAATIAPGQNTTFQVRFDPSALGLRTATVSIANDDDSEHPYTFAVQGTGTGPPPSLFVVDDATLGFTRVGDWTATADAQAYDGQMLTIAAGAGLEKATWDFSGLSSGAWDVYATWISGFDRATKAPFTISNLVDNSYTIFVNQQKSPTIALNGRNWGSLGLVEVNGGGLQVGLTNIANGMVVADAVMVVRHGYVPPPAPAPLAHNAVLPQDVNDDGRVSPLDLLLVINHLSKQSAVPSVAPLAATAAPAAATTQYLDVNGDRRVSPIDALLVINYLLQLPSAVPSAAPQAAPAVGGSPALAAVAVDQAIHTFDATSFEPAETPRVELAAASDTTPSGKSTEPSAAALTSGGVQASFASDAEEDDETSLAATALERAFVGP